MCLSSTAFNEALIQQTKSLLSLSRSLTRDEFSAKDLVQDTLYHALKNKDKFQDGTNLRAWLHTMMRHIFISDFRRRKTRAELLAEHRSDVAFCPAGSAVQNHGLCTIGLREITTVLFGLPFCFRLAFEMYFAGYKYHEIAQLQQVPLGTVKSRIFIARKALMVHLKCAP